MSMRKDDRYLDASGIELLGITFPVFKVDFDLMGAITEKLLSMTEGSSIVLQAPRPALWYTEDR